jgi:hypothetical protein
MVDVVGATIFNILLKTTKLIALACRYVVCAVKVKRFNKG